MVASRKDYLGEGSMNIFKRNKIALTDRRGKTIYVKQDKVDNYVLTANGWLLKNIQ